MTSLKRPVRAASRLQAPLPPNGRYPCRIIFRALKGT